MTAVWAAFVSALAKLVSWLPTILAYLAGRKSVHTETEIETLKKEKEYAEIAAKDRDDLKRMREGTY